MRWPLHARAAHAAIRRSALRSARTAHHDCCAAWSPAEARGMPLLDRPKAAVDALAAACDVGAMGAGSQPRACAGTAVVAARSAVNVVILNMILSLDEAVSRQSRMVVTLAVTGHIRSIAVERSFSQEARVDRGPALWCVRSAPASQAMSLRTRAASAMRRHCVEHRWLRQQNTQPLHSIPLSYPCRALCLCQRHAWHRNQAFQPSCSPEPSSSRRMVSKRARHPVLRGR